MTAIADNSSAPPRAFALVKSLLATIGRTANIDEELMDAATAIGGCGPAHVRVKAEALTEAGVKLGLAREISLEMVAETMLGVARMLQATGWHPALRKDDVTTPAGYTIDAFLELEAGNLQRHSCKSGCCSCEGSTSASRHPNVDRPSRLS